MAHAVVLVLGDLGRSPRMQYHAWSLSQMEGISSVTQVGYSGEKPIFPDDSVITEERFSPWEFNCLRRISLLHAVFKGFGILVKIFFTLLMIRQYNIIIIQNPPCLPALLAARIIAVFNGSIVVIDWHNLGYAMFEQRLGSKHLLVRLAFTLEKFACRLAHKHICVSSAMKDWLAEHFTIQATVLYDRPAKLFIKVDPTLRERHHLLSSLEFSDDLLFPNTVADGEIYRNLKNDTNDEQKREVSTCQTYCKTQQKCEGGGGDDDGDDGDVDYILLKENCCKMIVSATSWTEDEDFSMLLVALQELNLLLTTHSTATATATSTSIAVEGCERILIVVTGKGPLKAEFESSVLDLTSRGLLNRVAIRTAWLSSNDYSLLLRCADLGICLHTSTSGLDLPMKILDMFGSALPVCAVRFPTITELVHHGQNGMIFDNASELTEQILHLLFPHVLIDIREKRLSTSNSSSSSSSGSGSGSSSNSIINETTDSIEEDLPIPSDTIESSEITSEDTKEKRITAHPVTIEHNNYNQITLAALKGGAAEIGSWDDNWKAVLSPLVQSWIR